MTFMSPELMVPSNFGFKDSIPTPEADIYAFGLVIFQVREQDREYMPFTYIVQVLTGENPFRGVRMGELSFNVVMGARPTKPENASAIGFSDSLWDFTQQCWHGDAKVRPKVGGVVTQLERAAANWGRIMPPFVEVKNIVPVSEKLVSSDSISNCKFEILVSPRYCPLSNGTDKFIVSSPNVAPESPTESQTTVESLGLLGTPSTGCTVPLQEELQETAVKPSVEPPADRWGTIQRRPQDLPDDPHAFQHLTQNFQPPPSALPPPKRKPLQRFKAKLREFFHFRR